MYTNYITRGGGLLMPSFQFITIFLGIIQGCLPIGVWHAHMTVDVTGIWAHMMYMYMYTNYITCGGGGLFNALFPIYHYFLEYNTGVVFQVPIGVWHAHMTVDVIGIWSSCEEGI